MLLSLAAFVSTLFVRSIATYPSSGKRGAVVTEVGECSDIGVDILKKGGNAADAIIASSLCVGTIAGYHSGIGGGGFMIVRFKNKAGTGYDYETIDFREKAPAAGNETMFSNGSDSKVGGLAVAAPGELRGWQTLHNLHRSGKLTWKELFQPAIDLARNGFKVNVDLAKALSGTGYEFLTKESPWKEVYAPNGILLKKGDTCFRKKYADTLEKIAENGADSFYTGQMANNTASAVLERGGILTTEDLANYTVKIRKPSNITYRNHRIFSTVSPSSGSVVLSALKIFEGYPGNASNTDPDVNLTTHHLIQATKFGYGQRTNLGDPDFTANVSTLEQKFLQESTAQAVRAKIVDTKTFNASYYDIHNYLPVNDSGTSHLAAVDESGMVISLTTTINLFWGSRVMTKDGIILNDQMDDFSSPGQINAFGFTPSPVNFIKPFKRPQSSIASSIAEDLLTGQFVVATGSAGGSHIITATIQNLYHYLDQGLTPNVSVHQARWHDQLSPETSFECSAPELGIEGFNNGTKAYLKAIGYNVTSEDLTKSTGHIIGRSNDGVFAAANDPRKAAGGGAAF